LARLESIFSGFKWRVRETEREEEGALGWEKDWGVREEEFRREGKKASVDWPLYQKLVQRVQIPAQPVLLQQHTKKPAEKL
jgi:hypothetical protein